MRKLIGPLALSLALSSCADIHSRYTMAELSRDRIDWKSHCRNLSTPERLKPFNPILEQLSGAPALDVSRVHLVDGQTLKRKCSANFAGGCFVIPGSRIYINKKLALTRVSRPGPTGASPSFDGRLNPNMMVEGTEIMTAYAHEQGHAMDRSLSSTLRGSSFDEMEAMVFAMLFAKTFGEKYEKVRGTDIFYAELDACLSRIARTLGKISSFRNNGQLRERYKSDVLGLLRGEERDIYKESAPHNLGSIAFAILIREFNNDLKALYGFIHSHSDGDVERAIDAPP